MSTLKLEPIESKTHRIVFAPNTGGCFFIENMTERTSTMLFTGSEGLEDYAQLKRAWRKNHALFDSLCSEYTFNKN